MWKKWKWKWKWSDPVWCDGWAHCQYLLAIILFDFKQTNEFIKSVSFECVSSRWNYCTESCSCTTCKYGLGANSDEQVCVEMFDCGLSMIFISFFNNYDSSNFGGMNDIKWMIISADILNV